MKILICLLAIVWMVAGCSQKTTMETLGDACAAEPVLEPAEVMLDIPDHLADPVFQNDSEGTLYLCDEYSLSVQTLAGGNLDQTIHNCTGYCMNDLTVIETNLNGSPRYDFVCTTTGEGQEQVVRVAIVDDGVFHYVVAAMAPAENGESCTDIWNEVFASLRISTDQ